MAVRVQLEPALVLHARAYRESSLLLEAFTFNHGRVGVVARGVRRGRSPGRSLLQPFVPLLLSWSSRGELGTLAGYELDGAGAMPAGKALFSGFYINELMLRVLTRDDPHPELFLIYAQTIARLGSAMDGSQLETLLRGFEKQLLEAIGYGLVFFDHEGEGMAFATDVKYRYLRETGPLEISSGYARDAGADGVVLSGETLAALRDDAPMSPASLAEAKILMRYLLEPLLGDRPLQTRELFRSA